MLVAALFNLAQDGHVVFAVLFGALGTGGVPHQQPFGGIALSLGGGFEVGAPLAGILKGAFVHLAVVLPA